jgi:hypothetical protein
LSESPTVIATLIDAYLRTLQPSRGIGAKVHDLFDDKDKDPLTHFTESLAYAGVHEVVAVLKWVRRHHVLTPDHHRNGAQTLRHLHYPEGFSPATSQNGFLAWSDKLRAESETTKTPADTYARVLSPLIPASHSALLDEVLGLASQVIALAEVNGMSSTTVARSLGFWLFGALPSTAKTVDDFLAACDKATDAFELVLHVYLQAQNHLPVRLREVVDRYPASPRPPRVLRATLSSQQSPATVGDLLRVAFGAEVDVDDAAAEAEVAWPKLTEGGFELAVDDDAARAIKTASPATLPSRPPSSKLESPSRRRSFTIDAPRPPPPRTSETMPDFRQRNLSDGPAFGRLPNNSTSALPNPPSWSDFASGGFGTSAVDLGLDVDLLKSSTSTEKPSKPTRLIRKTSRSRKSTEQQEGAARPASDKPSGGPNEPPRITNLVLAHLDSGIADLFLDALAEHHLREAWPTFALVRLRTPLPSRDESIRLLLVEHAIAVPKPLRKEDKADGAAVVANDSSSSGKVTAEERKRDKRAFASFGACALDVYAHQRSLTSYAQVVAPLVASPTSSTRVHRPPATRPRA